MVQRQNGNDLSKMSGVRADEQQDVLEAIQVHVQWKQRLLGDIQGISEEVLWTLRKLVATASAGTMVATVMVNARNSLDSRQRMRITTSMLRRWFVSCKAASARKL